MSQFPECSSTAPCLRSLARPLASTPTGRDDYTKLTKADDDEVTYELDAFATYGGIPDDWQKDATHKKLTIGQGITSIGDNAFDGCSALVGDLVIPRSVTSIGEEAFKDVAMAGTLTLGSQEETYELWWSEGNMDDTMVYTSGGVDYFVNWYNGYPKMPGLFDPFNSPDGIVSTRALKQRDFETSQYYVFNGPTLQFKVPTGAVPAFNNENPATDSAELTIQNFSGASGGDVTNHYWKPV